MHTVPDYVQTDDKSLVRDTRSKALLNTNRVALARHRATRSKREQQKLITDEVQSLRQEVADLTELVRALLNR